MGLEFRPDQKVSREGRAARRYRRKVASPKRWAAIRDEKLIGQRCRACGLLADQLHHILPRGGRHGDDIPANLAPVCFGCHERVTRRDPAACLALIAGLDDLEYARAVDLGGEYVWERVYGVRYER